MGLYTGVMAGRRVIQDRYFKDAKASGYVARSAYKLLEINEKKRLIRPRDHVLDLGCAPGAWLQVAAEVVGDRGRVVGLDLQTSRVSPGANVHALVGDINELEPAALRRAGLEGGDERFFDVVVSDMAPSTSGDLSDHFRSVRLCEEILVLLPGLLRRGGHLAMKVFEGEAYPGLMEQTAERFARVKGFKPKASRDVSREMYIVAHEYRGQ